MDMNFEAKEKEVLQELKAVTGNQSYLITDIIEWSEYELEETEGQVKYYLPKTKVYVIVEPAKSTVKIPESLAKPVDIAKAAAPPVKTVTEAPILPGQPGSKKMPVEY